LSNVVSYLVKNAVSLSDGLVKNC